MTDLTPNDLSHLSDEEFLALCPQGEHAPGPEPLTFNASSPPEEVIRLDEKGFHYKGQFIEDAGEAHRLLLAFLKSNGHSLETPHHRHRTGGPMTTAPDFRALCAEFVEAFTDENTYTQTIELIERACDALAILSSEPPTDEELKALWHELFSHDDTVSSGDVEVIARAALDRWGHG